jgi:small-conductance mechanosensitive channel
MASGMLTNSSLSGLGTAISINVKVNVSSDIEKVESALAETAQEVTRLLQLALTEEPQVALTSEFTDPFLQFLLRVPVQRLSDRDQVTTALHTEITRLYREGSLRVP